MARIVLRVRARCAIVVLCIFSAASIGDSKEWAPGDKPSPPNAALLNGARNGENEEALTKHLEFGATIDCKCEHGRTPLITAILHEKIPTAHALVLCVHSMLLLHTTFFMSLRASHHLPLTASISGRYGCKPEGERLRWQLASPSRAQISALGGMRRAEALHSFFVHASL